MPSLNSVLINQIRQVPKLLLARVLEEKLKEQGVTENLKEISVRFAEHILSGDSDNFEFDEGDNAEEREISLSFSEEESNSLLQSVEKIHDDLPRVIRSIVKRMAKKNLKAFRKDWPEVHVWHKGEFQKFKDNIELRWGRGLTNLRMLLEAGREIGENRISALRRSKAKKNIVKREVLLLLHLRACQTMVEIITLLESGLADGAMARWRTLYELTVVAELVAKHGDDIARRYLDHAHVAAKKELENEKKTALTIHAALNEQERIVLENYEAVLDEYGKEFGGDYGWAAHHLNNKSPRFRHIEAAVDMLELPPEYKLASYKIHAGVTGVTWNLGQLGDSDIPLAGASNAGLEAPAMHSAYTFVRLTTLIAENHIKLENQIAINMLLELRNGIEKEFTKASKKLLKDALKLRLAKGD